MPDCQARSPISALWQLQVAVTLLCFAPVSLALDLGISDWQLHGFLSQGYIWTSGNKYFGNSQGLGSLDFTELGLNVLGHPWPEHFPNLLISSQGIYRNAGGSDRLGIRLDYAHVDYHIPFGKSSKLGIRLGRVKQPWGLYNETRDIVWTRPGVLLPQSIYLDTLGLRQAGISSDGGTIYGRYAYAEHAVTAELLVAEVLDNTGGSVRFFTGLANPIGTLDGRPIIIGRTGYDWREGRVKLLLSLIDLDRDFRSASATAASGNTKTFSPIISAQLNLEDWSFTFEYDRIDSRRDGFTPGGVLIQNTSESFYLQAQYRIAPGWSALLRYDNYAANAEDRAGNRASATTQLPRHRFFSEDITFGLRRELARNWLVAMEYHYIDGTALLSTVDNPGLTVGGGAAHTDLITAIFSYHF